MATATELVAQSASKPDEVRPFEKDMGRVEIVHLPVGDAGLGTFESGWRWSEHVKPIAGTDTCQVDHVGYVLSGSMTIHMDDGTETKLSEGDFFHIPPGHDAWVEGGQECRMVDFGGLAGYAKPH